MNLSQAATSAASSVLPLGLNFGVSSGLVARIPLVAPYAVFPVAKNMAPGSAGVINGAPTISNSNFIVNTPNTDMVVLPFGDNGGDFTIFAAPKSADTTAGWSAISTYGGDANGSITGIKGVALVANTPTTVRFRDFEVAAGASSEIDTTQTGLSSLNTVRYCFCFQRKTSGGTTTRTLYNLTANGTASPVVTTSTNVPLQNKTNNWTLGCNPNGGQGTPTKISNPLIDIYQRALSVAEIQLVYQYWQRWFTALPTPPDVI